MMCVAGATYGLVNRDPIIRYRWLHARLQSFTNIKWTYHSSPIRERLRCAFYVNWKQTVDQHHVCLWFEWPWRSGDITVTIYSTAYTNYVLFYISSISSGINALSATALADILEPLHWALRKRCLSDKFQVVIAKLLGKCIYKSEYTAGAPLTNRKCLVNVHRDWSVKKKLRPHKTVSISIKSLQRWSYGRDG